MKLSEYFSVKKRRFQRVEIRLKTDFSCLRKEFLWANSLFRSLRFLRVNSKLRSCEDNVVWFQRQKLVSEKGRYSTKVQGKLNRAKHKTPRNLIITILNGCTCIINVLKQIWSNREPVTHLKFCNEFITGIHISVNITMYMYAQLHFWYLHLTLGLVKFMVTHRCTS